jgi:hypothetical protein
MLQDLPGYTEFTNLFDQYKIDWVELRFIPVINTSNSALPCDSLIYSTVDFDDNTATNAGSIKEYELCEVHSPTQEWKVSLAPRVAIAAYAGAFTSYANQASWIDVASTSVQHFGVKVGCQNANGSAQTWKVVGKYHVSFRSAR